MFYFVIGLLVGVVLGFALLAVVAAGKNEDMFFVIRHTAFNDDPSYCKKYMEDYR